MIFSSLARPVSYLDYIKFQNKSRKKRRESILFLEHPATITAGIASNPSNLLESEEILAKKDIIYLPVKRGGDHTAHEPGQLVIYFHIDIREREIPLGEFLDFIQDSCLNGLKETWGISLVTDRQRPGLYWKANPSKKLVSIGIYFKSFFSSFGIAINLSNQCEVFRSINPCGIDASSMVSLDTLGIPHAGDIEYKNKFIDIYSRQWMEFLTKKYPAKNSKKVRWL